MKQKKNKYRKNDFLISDLPKNRVQLFFDIIKNQWSSLLILAFFTLLVFVPLIISRYQNISVINNILSSDIENKNYHIQFAYLIHYAVNILLIILISIFFSGLFRVYKKMSYNDGYFLAADFFKGIKENIKEFLIMYSIYGVLCFMVESISIFYLLKDSMLYYLFKIINYGFLLPILLVSSALSVIYSDNVFKKIKIAFTLYIKSFFKIVFAIIIMIAPLYALVVGSTLVQLFVPIAYCFIYMPLALLGFIIMLNGIFDKHINKKNFPSLVNKGMYVKK